MTKTLITAVPNVAIIPDADKVVAEQDRSSAVFSDQLRTAPDRPAGTVSGPDILSQQFSQQILDALINSQQGTYQLKDVSGRPVQSLGESGVGGQAVEIRARRAPVAGRVMSDSGTLDPTTFISMPPEALAAQLIASFGSSGQLSLSQVEHAYQLDSPTVSSGYRDATRKLVDGTWRVLAQGKSSLTAEELAQTIQKSLYI